MKYDERARALWSRLSLGNIARPGNADEVTREIAAALRAAADDAIEELHAVVEAARDMLRCGATDERWSRLRAALARLDGNETKGRP